jgi:hypothetical protein
MSVAFLFSVNPLLAQNTHESFRQPIQLAQQDSAAENDQLEKATKEAEEAIDASLKAAQEEIDKATREAEIRLNETKVALENRANWGWLGLLGLLGLFGLAGKGK